MKQNPKSREPHDAPMVDTTADHRQTPADSAAAGCFEHCPDSRERGLLHPYRVFISYSHGDAELASFVETHLRSEGLFPITDHEIRIGEAFSEEIREMIECAHVFMPLVTPNANKRLWVQQEIGYAAALHVPVCPIAIGDLPAGMTEQIQGIHLAAEGDDLPKMEAIEAVVRERLKCETIDDLVRRARRRTRQGRYDCAMYWNERQELLVALTEAARREACKLLRHREPDKPFDRNIWRLRQRTGFGSFSIPDAGVDSPAWMTRDHNRYHTQHERRLLRRERQVMEDYMQCFGCDLIIDPRIPIGAGSAPENTGGQTAPDSAAASGDPRAGDPQFKHSPLRTAFRIRLLADFVEHHLDDDKLRVVIPKQKGAITTNLVIVGDWFATEAVVPHYRGGGYERTMFTRHAPTVLNMIDRFEQDFRDCLDGADSTAEAVRAAKEQSLETLRHWGGKNEEKLADEDRKHLDKVCQELRLDSKS